MLVCPDSLGQKQRLLLGHVALESIEKHQLLNLLEKHNGKFSISAPTVQVNPPVSIDNDIDERLKEARHYLKNAIAQIPQEERMAYASALWRHSEGMGVVLKAFTPEVVQHLQHIPPITLTGIQYPNNEAGQIASGEYTARFSQYSYVDKNGVTKTPASIAILTDDGKELQFGALDPRSIHLPIGTTVKAHLEIAPSGKIAKMQVLDRVHVPEVKAQASEQPPELNPKDLIERSPTESVQSIPATQGYSPSREELRQWCAIAMIGKNQPLQEYVTGLGTQLKALYGTETGTPGATPPLEYRHPAVVISESDRQRMQQSIEAVKSIIHSPTQPLQSSQLEVG